MQQESRHHSKLFFSLFNHTGIVSAPSVYLTPNHHTENMLTSCLAHFLRVIVHGDFPLLPKIPNKILNND